MGRVGGKGKGQDDISLMRIPSLARFQSQDCDYRGGHAVYFHMRICGCGCDQARPQHLRSSILANFRPDIHVFRVKNRISHIFPFPGGSPGQSLFLRYEIEKRLRVSAVYFQTALPPDFVQDHDAVDQAAGEHLQLFVSVHLELHTLLHCSITTQQRKCIRYQ